MEGRAFSPSPSHLLGHRQLHGGQRGRGGGRETAGGVDLPCALARSPWLLQGEMGVTMSAPSTIQGLVEVADVNYLHTANAACTLIYLLLSEQPVLVFLFILGGLV